MVRAQTSLVLTAALLGITLRAMQFFDWNTSFFQKVFAVVVGTVIIVLMVLAFIHHGIFSHEAVQELRHVNNK